MASRLPTDACKMFSSVQGSWIAYKTLSASLDVVIHNKRRVNIYAMI